MNRDRILRLAYFNALNGQLTYNSAAVPISDSKLESDASVYVIIGAQTASNTEFSDYNKYCWTTSISLEIHSVHQDSVSKDIVDEVGEQIEAIIIGDSQEDENGLVVESGWSITGVTLTTSYPNTTYLKHSDGSNYVTKLLTFSQTIEKI
jgi:hypothetical protein